MMDQQTPITGSPCHQITFHSDLSQISDTLMEKTFDEMHHAQKTDFFFLVDRSGSMGFPMAKMQLTKQAMQLFMMSLPTGCNFQIISYGSRFEWMGGNKQKKMFEYGDETMQFANMQIERFQDNFDGTDIYAPLSDVFNSKLTKGNKIRIFLLTDGEVDEPNKVIELIQKNC